MKAGIAARMALVLALFAGLAVVLTGYSVYYAGRERLIAAAQERLLTTTQVLGRRFAGVLDDAVRDARTLAENGDALAVLAAPAGRPAGARADNLAAQFHSLLKFNPPYYQIRLIGADDNGLERVRLDRDTQRAISRVSGDDLQEKAHYPYVYETLALPEDAVYVSPIAINHELGAHAGAALPTVRVAAPVRDANGVRRGVVVINLSLDGMFAVLGEDLPANLELYLADSRGEFLIHPEAGRAFAFDRGQSARVQEQYPATARLFSGATRVVQTTQDLHAGQARAVVAAFVRQARPGRSDDNFVVIGLDEPLGQVLESTTRLAATIIPVLLLATLIAIVLSIVLARNLTRPLRRMAEAARAFPAHPGEADMPVARGDEIGILARALVAMQEDIARKLRELEAQRSELVHLARHDTLTGLPNRLLFNDRIEQLLARARRTREPFALLFVDLDDFKTINDRYGHAAGDFVLRTVAQRLTQSMREMDTVARLGGDEFVVLLEGTNDAQYLAGVAEKLVAAVLPGIPWQGRTLQVSVSVGMSTWPGNGETADALCAHADAGMYRAKAAGGNRALMPD